jgi:hypothetical protein
MNLESEIRSLQESRKQQQASSSSSGQEDGDRVQLGGKGHFDRDLYGDDGDRRGGGMYLQSLPMDGEDEDEEEVARGSHPSSRSRINAPSSLVQDSILQTSDEGDNSNYYRENFGSGLVNTRIADRENEVTLNVVRLVMSELK